MKKFSMIFITLMMLFALVFLGCNNPANPDDGVPNGGDNVYTLEGNSFAFNLRKDSIEAKNWITISSDASWSNRTETYQSHMGDYPLGDYLDNKNPRYFEMTVSGVAAFYLDMSTNSTGRTYSVTIGNAAAEVVNHGGTGLERKYFETGATGEVTIKVSGGPSTVYPLGVELLAVVGNFDPAESVEISGPATVAVDAAITLTAAVLPNTANQDVIWESSDTTKATIDENGNLTGVAEGTVTVTAKAVSDNTKLDTHVVTVTAPVQIDPLQLSSYLTAPQDSISTSLSYGSIFTVEPGNSSMKIVAESGTFGTESYTHVLQFGGTSKVESSGPSRFLKIVLAQDASVDFYVRPGGSGNRYLGLLTAAEFASFSGSIAAGDGTEIFTSDGSSPREKVTKPLVAGTYYLGVSQDYKISNIKVTYSN